MVNCKNSKIWAKQITLRTNSRVFLLLITPVITLKVFTSLCLFFGTVYVWILMHVLYFGYFPERKLLPFTPDYWSISRQIYIKLTDMDNPVSLVKLTTCFWIVATRSTQIILTQTWEEDANFTKKGLGPLQLLAFGREKYTLHSMMICLQG